MQPEIPESLIQNHHSAGHFLEIFRETGAYLTGHFRLTSGLHSPNYLQSAIVLQYPQHAETFGRELGSRVFELFGGKKIDAVISPALGGLVIGHEVARSLGVRFVFTERDSDRKMQLRRGFVLKPGERVVVIEDVITTGGSTREVIDIVRALGAVPVAAGSIIDRSGGAVDLGIPRAALETLHVVAYEASGCPMCLAGEPVVKPGSRPSSPEL
jgi:orotate phosphoribosyltransferase